LADSAYTTSPFRAPNLKNWRAIDWASPPPSFARGSSAREILRERFAKHNKSAGTNLQVNADMGPAEAQPFCALDDAGKQLMRAAMKQLNMSARVSSPPQPRAHDCGLKSSGLRRNLKRGSPAFISALVTFHTFWI